MVNCNTIAEFSLDSSQLQFGDCHFLALLIECSPGALWVLFGCSLNALLSIEPYRYRRRRLCKCCPQGFELKLTEAYELKHTKLWGNRCPRIDIIRNEWRAQFSKRFDCVESSETMRQWKRFFVSTTNRSALQTLWNLSLIWQVPFTKGESTDIWAHSMNPFKCFRKANTIHDLGTMLWTSCSKLYGIRNLRTTQTSQRCGSSS